MKNFEPCCIMDGNKIMMYLGHPSIKTSTKIDVTMAYKLGLAIGEKHYNNIFCERLT